MGDDNTSPKDGNTNAQSASDKQQAVAAMKKKIHIEEISPGIFRATTDQSKYIIEYDMGKCIGAASCSAIAPLTFFMNEENKAEFRGDVDNFDEDEVILAAAQSCPVFAIKVIDKTSGEVLFPIDVM